MSPDEAAQELASGPGLPDAAELLHRLASLPFRGLALLAPARVDTRSEVALPMRLAYQRPVAREAAGPLSRNACLLAADPDGAWCAAGPHEVDREDGSTVAVPPTPATAPVARALLRSVTEVEARASVGPAWHAGRLVVTALCWDWASNSVEVELLGDPAPPAPRVATAPGRDGALPRFERTALPAGEPFVLERTEGVVVLRAHLERPLLERDRVTSAADPGLVAVVPVTAVVSTLGRPLPWLRTWRVPVREPGGGVDLAAALAREADLGPGEHLVRLVVDGRPTPPRPLSIESRSS